MNPLLYLLEANKETEGQSSFQEELESKESEVKNSFIIISTCKLNSKNWHLFTKRWRQQYMNEILAEIGKYLFLQIEFVSFSESRSSVCLKINLYYILYL